jgi:hypothetical protein
VLLSACSRSDLPRYLDAGVEEVAGLERCNIQDDDRDGKVDEDFRDEQGRYVHVEHCGSCELECAPASSEEHELACEVVDDVPRCVASRCSKGYAPTREGRCAPIDAHLCLTCAQDSDCGPLRDAVCAQVAGEARCTLGCASGCPDGYACDMLDDVCLPVGGSCSCNAGQSFDLACSPGGEREPGAPVCVGHAHCEHGVISYCITDD